jgi:hypothetical protein
MGIARLLAKGWIIFCLFAAAHALRLNLLQGLPLASSLPGIGICALLFIAMGLLFVGGFGVSAGHFGKEPWLAQFKPHRLLPGFDEAVFISFVVLSFLNQAFFAPVNMDRYTMGHLPDPIYHAVDEMQAAIYFVVPGQRALVSALESCTMDGGRVFAAAFAWLLAAIYLASAVSRLKLQAGLIRLEASDRPQILGPTLRAFLFGIVAVVSIQFLFVGSAYPWLRCSAFADVTGALLIGLAPLMLAYLIVAALASLLASAPENSK